MKKNKDYNIATSNIFADLELPNPNELLAKAELARQINLIIKQQKLTQMSVATLLGIDQPKISALNKGKLAGFSFERLFKFLNILDQTITIKISPKTKFKKDADVVVTVQKPKKLRIIKQPTDTASRSIYARKKK